MSNAPYEGTIWLNGEYIPANEAKTHIMSYTLHYGMGAFEGVRAYKTAEGTAIFRAADHSARLLRSLHMLNMKIPYTKEELIKVQQEVLRRNNLTAAYLRPMCFYGSETLGLRIKHDTPVYVMVAAWAWGAYLGAEQQEHGVSVAFSSYTRQHPMGTLTKAKANGNYIASSLATQEAIAAGHDDALMLDLQGFVAEASVSNFFMVRNGVLYTPEATSCLEGITRETIMQLAKDEGIPVVEKRITRDEVYVADEAFLTGTAVEVAPIRAVDHRQIGAGKRGPITTRLQALYFDTVMGKNPRHIAWLTKV
jgi:branched-chain amino acid aminotransferase